MSGAPRKLAFDRSFEPRHGEAVTLSPLVRRVTASNASPFTFQGTNSYIVGTDELAIIDPGPEDENHLTALLDAIGPARVAAIVVTHTHRDHSPLARALARRTGAPIVGAAPHRPARALRIGEINPLDAAADTEHAPDRVLVDGDRVQGPDWTLETVATAGHTANHLAFALPEESALFSGDHVMAWATSIVAPPDGAMADYMCSLQRLLARRDRVYWPGHGGPVTSPAGHVRGLRTHRRMRERSILERLRRGDRTIPAIVAATYTDTPKALHGAAALSVLAHLEDLVTRGLVDAPGGLGLDGEFRLT